MAVWGPRLSGIQCKDPGGGLAAKPLEADDTFFVKIIVCHSFKNDIAMFAFIAYNKCRIWNARKISLETEKW